MHTCRLGAASGYYIFAEPLQQHFEKEKKTQQEKETLEGKAAENNKNVSTQAAAAPPATTANVMQKRSWG